MEDRITAVVTDEDGLETTMEFCVERTFSVGDKAYLALIPSDGDEDVYLFDFEQTAAGVRLLEIEDDDAYDRAAAAYEALLKQEEGAL